MRYSKDHKAQARVAILQAAAGTMKQKGFDGVGVDGLAASAGVTSGALYSNFANKEALLEAMVAEQLGSDFACIAHDDPAVRRQRLLDVLSIYLSAEHREDPANGCLIPALSADVARASDSVRKTYENKTSDVIALLASAMPGLQEQRESRAWAVLAAMVGAVTVARALPEGELARAMLDATLAQVTKMITEE